jgi:hypothetical protein
VICRHLSDNCLYRQSSPSTDILSQADPGGFPACGRGDYRASAPPGPVPIREERREIRDLAKCHPRPLGPSSYLASHLEESPGENREVAADRADAPGSG